MSAPYNGQSSNKVVPGVTGLNTAAGDGVVGRGRRGVVGESAEFQGVFGHSINNAGLVGESTNFHAVFGLSHSVHNGALFGANDGGGFGVIGRGLIGVTGESTGGLAGMGLLGTSDGGDGVVGRGHRGVVGESTEFQGVFGHSVTNAGVVGESDRFHAVFGISHSANDAGVFAANDAGGLAAIFDGRVEHRGPSSHTDVFVSGDIQMLRWDVAEDFDVEDGQTITPGSVVAIGGSGGLRLADEPYDTAVIGIVSGANGFEPALRLDRARSDRQRLPVALVGKVMCLVDAEAFPIRAGDLLCSSSTPGHAMRAVDVGRSVGAIIGKALRSLDRGSALIPVIAILQ